MNRTRTIILTFGAEKFLVPVHSGDSSELIRETIKDYLNKHGQHTATIEKDGGLKYGGANTIFIAGVL